MGAGCWGATYSLYCGAWAGTACCPFIGRPRADCAGANRACGAMEPAMEPSDWLNMWAGMGPPIGGPRALCEAYITTETPRLKTQAGTALQWRPPNDTQP